MDTPILASRRDLLRRTQNPDGGWGYFAGKQSWFEPTAYAVLALHGDTVSAEAAKKAWTLLKSWQLSDGGWKPCASMSMSTWVTSLGVTLCAVQQEFGPAFEKGVRWLLQTRGIESSLRYRIQQITHLGDFGRDTSFSGWPWRTDSAAWVEPTAHALVALKKAAPHFREAALRARIRDGEKLLLTVRSRDGGWNYGSASALGVDLPSYPETTALAMLGLQQHTPESTFARIRQFDVEAPSRLADAWMSISLAALGRAAEKTAPADPPADLMIAALEAIAAPGGNAALLKTGSVA